MTERSSFETLLELATPIRVDIIDNSERVHGAIKTVPEDFEVTEIPLYPFAGEGEHIYLFVEKRFLNTQSMIEQLAHHLGAPIYSIGYAGQKDRIAVTRQWVSIPVDKVDTSKLSDLVGPITNAITVLQVDRHTNKLRTGHLFGNRFSVRIQSMIPNPPVAFPILEHHIHKLTDYGVPNFYGSQRFGRHGMTLQIGLDILDGNEESLKRLKGRSRQFRKLALSAVQSGLFNAVLKQRYADKTLHTVLLGDRVEWVLKRRSYLVRTLDDQLEAQEAVTKGEAVITGPIMGNKYSASEGEAFEVESKAIEPFNLSAKSFEAAGRLATGTRRPYLIPIIEPQLYEEPTALRAEFTLPAGSYATVVMENLLRLQVAPNYNH